VVVAVVALVATVLASGAWATPGSDPGPPPWAPGPGGPDVIHVMHTHDAHGTGTGTAPLLTYHGGAVQTAPAVYVVFWGSQWTGNDPSGEAPALQQFLSGLYGTRDTWSTSTTQYCQGVVTGSTTCTAGSTAISHPATTPLLDVLYDSTVVAPSHPRQRDLAGEAVRAAGIFKAGGGLNPKAPFDPKAQFVIATAHNNNATGFGSSYCAWHSSTSSSYGNNLAYTNFPYMTDAGASCGANFVNKMTGALDGVTIVGGHEYAETVTDPFPSSGWIDANGAENGDKCAWISSGLQGAATNVTISSATFPAIASTSSTWPVQSLWSNSFNSGKGGCVTSYP
jgi:hypothetical protein